MRLIGTLSNENLANRLSLFLSFRGINNTCEGSFEPATGSMSYAVWIHEDDQIPQATEILGRFQKNPSDKEFDAPPPEVLPPDLSEEMSSPSPEPTRTFGTQVTTFFILLCSLLFLLNSIEELPWEAKGAGEASVLMTPLQDLFLYDFPPAFEELQKTLSGQKTIQDPLKSLESLRFWHGAYDWAVLKIKGQDPEKALGPLFTKIREGEVWRLFTPCLMHGGFFHILFNMIWLWVLGKPIERRIGAARYLLLIGISAIAANTVQYLMSGPLFLGFSGVVMALAGFTWQRERLAPWEGYPLNRSTTLFLLVYIGAMLVLQIASFVFEIFSQSDFTLVIANSAHIAGAIVGVLLARLSFFAQRVPK
jgi:GlpG protein